MTHFFKYFDELTNDELYDILALRQEVFVVEQNCPYKDADGKLDKEGIHLCIYEKDRLIAYARILSEGIAYVGHAAIGRIITHKTKRGTGLGNNLLDKSITYIKENTECQSIKIGAQTYAKSFYEKHGFNTCGKEYDEDGIPHIHMVLTF